MSISKVIVEIEWMSDSKNLTLDTSICLEVGMLLDSDRLKYAVANLGEGSFFAVVWRLPS